MRYLASCVLAIALLTPLRTWAGPLEVAALVAGTGAGFVVHEAGHELMGRALGNPPAWHWTDATWTTKSRSNIAPIAMAGFGAEGLASEVCTLAVNHSNSFCVGLKMHYLINTAQYVVRSAFFAPGGHGDFTNLSHSDRNVAYAIITAHLAWTVLELAAPDAVPAWLTAEGITVRW